MTFISKTTPDRASIDAVMQGRHGDPFAILGPHHTEGALSVRAVFPGADSVEVLARHGAARLARMERLDEAGFWCATLPHDAAYFFRVHQQGAAYDIEDVYGFPPLLGDLDIQLLAAGRHHDFSKMLGAHVVEIDGISGTQFAVWAPNARRVSVVGDFNGWDGRRHPMRLRHQAGVWEIFIPRVGPGDIYKYEILGAWGELLPLKADPVAQATELPPRTGSIVPNPAAYAWHDADWMQNRAARQREDAPLSIYEVHVLSWMQDAERGGYSWHDLADQLIPYVQRLGFTHLELMPIMEYPFGGSWGYQPLGQFAPTARLGAPAGFAAFVDRCHQAGIGVLLDWVPAHFPTDTHGLASFDGTQLYEHADPREGFHRDWNTLIYNLGRNEVRGFLIGSALHWLEHYHVDGLRVDAVASMLYRDYSRPDGEWVPNRYGGRENLESIAFFKELSTVVAAHTPGAVLIAEESTAFPAVSRPVAEGGLGFDYKWNMGWMHDTLHYMEEEPIYRKWHHWEISFGLIYAFNERFVLPLSHDEVVYGKGSLIEKMPGDAWQRFANLRAYFAFMFTHPGKKLLFMGCEFAQWREWNHDRGLDWFLLDQPPHRGIQSLITDLNAAYRSIPALHARDCEHEGFAWVVLDDTDQSVFAYLRLGGPNDDPILVVVNFTPVARYNYCVGAPRAGIWQEILNTDSAIYGGGNIGNFGGVVAQESPSHGQPAQLSLALPPLATIILRSPPQSP